MTVNPSNGYAVIYRTGGTANFEWHRVAEIFERWQAQQCKEELERMGYPAMVERYSISLSVGLPDTFDCCPVSNESHNHVAQ